MFACYCLWKLGMILDTVMCNYKQLPTLGPSPYLSNFFRIFIFKHIYKYICPRNS